MEDYNKNIKIKLIIFCVAYFGLATILAGSFLIFQSTNIQETHQSLHSDRNTVALQNQNRANFSGVNYSRGYAEVNQTNSRNSSELEDQRICPSNVIHPPNGLLSPRIYAGILQPKSFLITNFKPLKSDILSYLNNNNISASIYIENLRNGANVGIHENSGYFPASLNKLPVAILVVQKIEDGTLSFDIMLPIHDYERTDTSGTLYLTKEKELSVRFLIEKMLKESDNTAFNVLYNHIDKNDLKQLLSYYDVSINVEYPDRRIEFLNHTDTVTARSLYNLFSSLYLSTVLNSEDSEYLLSLLTKTTFDIRNIASLPDNITVAQKYGEYYVDDTKLFHDCGIMYVGASRMFYCIMTKDLEPEDAQRVVGYIVNYMYNYIVDTRAKLDTYHYKGYNALTGLVFRSAHVSNYWT